MAILTAAVRVGHATDSAARTGCTVMLCPQGAVGGVDVRGAAPGTRETDLLRPGSLVERVQAVLLTGGSAFGLAAADGVMRWLYQQRVGFPTSVVPVPIVPAAVLFDLHVGQPKWPDADMGYAACLAAASDEPLPWGQVGAGVGATCGNLLGSAQASPGGVGLAQITLPDGTAVAAVVAVNALGHIVDPQTGQIVVGPRRPDGTFADSVALMLEGAHPTVLGQNTTIGCVVTTARLDKAACCRVASMAHDGLACTIRPVHTQYDGDVLFTLATAETPLSDVNLVGVAAAEVVARAVLNAVRTAGAGSTSL